MEYGESGNLDPVNEPGRSYAVTKTSRRAFAMAGAIAVVGLGWLAQVVTAQAPGLNPIGRVKVRGASVRGPTIQASSYAPVIHPRREWYQLEVAYETLPDWTDEITLTYYVLMRTDDRAEPFVLLKGEEAFVHISKGNHLARAFVHPSVLQRYGRVDGHAVEFRY